ncbi:MAG: sigma-70 region 4 domain-containing protein [Actinomycetes bacterium]
MALNTLSELLASLPPEERFILNLHYTNSRSASDIASVLGVPERAVQTVIDMAKARLLAIVLADFPPAP